MNVSRLSAFLVLALLAIAVPAMAQSQQNWIFDSGFEEGTKCRWAPVTCPLPPLNVSVAWAEEDNASPVQDPSPPHALHEEWLLGKFCVTATVNGSNAWIARSAQYDPSPDGSAGSEFVIRNASGALYTGGTTVGHLEPVTAAPGDTLDDLRFLNGQPRLVCLWVLLDNAAATPGSYGLRYAGVSVDHDGQGPSADGLTVSFVPNFGIGDVAFVDNTNHANLVGAAEPIK